jgi:hypothetical protein
MLVSLDWPAGPSFQDDTVPALPLLILVGGSMLLAASTILTGRVIGMRRAGYDDLHKR